MSQIKTLNGVQYTLPQYNDTDWGANTGHVLTEYLAAIADVTLQLSGGSFTLTADANFGATYGLVSTYFKSRTANIATAGQIRLASADVISWRNNANGANIDLSKDTSDNLKYNATKVLLSGAVVNADINAAAAIAYSKLALTGSIVNADVSASAAIALSKLAALTASRVPVLDASGFITASAVTATTLTYLDATSSIQTQLNARIANPLTGDLAAGGFKVTGSAAATTNGDLVRYEQAVRVADNQTVAGTKTFTSPPAVPDFSGTPLNASVYSQSLIKGWCSFNGTGTPAIRDSFNVSSLTDNGTADFTVVWDRDMNNDYAVVFTCYYPGIAYINNTGGAANTGVRVFVGTDSGGSAEVGYNSVIATGD